MLYTLQVQLDGATWQDTAYTAIPTMAQAYQLREYYSANWPQFQYRLRARVMLPGEPA